MYQGTELNDILGGPTGNGIFLDTIDSPSFVLPCLECSDVSLVSSSALRLILFFLFFFLYFLLRFDPLLLKYVAKMKL